MTYRHERASLERTFHNTLSDIQGHSMGTLKSVTSSEKAQAGIRGVQKAVAASPPHRSVTATCESLPLRALCGYKIEWKAAAVSDPGPVQA